MSLRIVIALFTLITGSACNAQEMRYTLYRTDIDLLSKSENVTARIHVASFDAKHDALSAEDNTKYNLANCEFAKQLFSDGQPHYRGSIYSSVKIKYWCEKGPYQ